MQNFHQIHDLNDFLDCWYTKLNEILNQIETFDNISSQIQDNFVYYESHFSLSSSFNKKQLRLEQENQESASKMNAETPHPNHDYIDHEKSSSQMSLLKDNETFKNTMKNEHTIFMTLLRLLQEALHRTIHRIISLIVNDISDLCRIIETRFNSMVSMKSNHMQIQVQYNTTEKFKNALDIPFQELVIMYFQTKKVVERTNFDLNSVVGVLKEEANEDNSFRLYVDQLKRLLLDGFSILSSDDSERIHLYVSWYEKESD